MSFIGIIEGAYKGGVIPPSVFINDITDLSVVETTALALKLLFSVPNSSSAISYYEVWVDDVLSQTISSNSEFIVYLDETTQYSIYIIPVDINAFKGKKSNTVVHSTNSTYISRNADEIYWMSKLIGTATNGIKVKRLNDNVETDVVLPTTGFISLTSTVSAGGDLGTWVGSNSAIITGYYGQKGFKNLVNINSSMKLIDAGVLQNIDGIPAFRIVSSGFTGIALEGIGFNSGVALSNASYFVAYKNIDVSLNTQAAGFGDVNTDGLSTQKRHWKIADDNSLRFDGGSLQGGAVAKVSGNKIRGTIKTGDLFKDYINGVKNIEATFTGTSIKDDFYLPTSLNPTNDSYVSGAVVFLSDQTNYAKVITNEMNKELNFY